MYERGPALLPGFVSCHVQTSSPDQPFQDNFPLPPFFLLLEKSFIFHKTYIITSFKLQVKNCIQATFIVLI